MIQHFFLMNWLKIVDWIYVEFKPSLLIFQNVDQSILLPTGLSRPKFTAFIVLTALGTVQTRNVVKTNKWNQFKPPELIYRENNNGDKKLLTRLVKGWCFFLVSNLCGVYPLEAVGCCWLSLKKKCEHYLINPAENKQKMIYTGVAWTSSGWEAQISGRGGE